MITERQKEVIELMKEGWELKTIIKVPGQSCPSCSGITFAWLYKEVGVVNSVHKSSFDSLLKKGLIEYSSEYFHNDHGEKTPIQIYTLTEEGRKSA